MPTKFPCYYFKGQGNITYGGFSFTRFIIGITIIIIIIILRRVKSWDVEIIPIRVLFRAGEHLTPSLLMIDERSRVPLNIGTMYVRNDDEGHSFWRDDTFHLKQLIFLKTDTSLQETMNNPSFKIIIMCTQQI